MRATYERRVGFSEETETDGARPGPRRLPMTQPQPAASPPRPDPDAWVDLHADHLFRFALFRLRDPTLAEDIVQETLLSALQSYDKFEGRGSVRTWLTGILKHKIIDHYRRAARETPVSQFEGAEFEHDEMFRASGKWKDHFDPDRAPVDWGADPEDLVRQGEFWEVFGRCLSPLPERIASAFTLREVDGHTSEEICEILGITTNNLWVILYRARTHLRRCLELNWFARPQAKG
jgi:RNA polymerase sigma-70 factor, ECF subfamily